MNIIISQYNYVTFNKCWGRCPNNAGNSHWAHLVVDNQADYDRLSKENYNGRSWWRHYDLISISCDKCGAQSPLRAADSQSMGIKEPKVQSGNVIDYAPTDEFPDELLDEVTDNGWHYVFFRENGTDSLHGQATFKIDLERLKKIREEGGEEELEKRKWEGDLKPEVVDKAGT